MAGSDDGCFYIWDRRTGIVEKILRGDSSIVNCLQPHPFTCLLATSGIDSAVRLWCPLPQVYFTSSSSYSGHLILVYDCNPLIIVKLTITNQVKLIIGKTYFTVFEQVFHRRFNEMVLFLVIIIFHILNY